MRPAAIAMLLVAVLGVGTARGAAVRARLARPGRGLQVRTATFTVPALSEREICQAIALPNRRDLDVDRISVASPTGPGYVSHHFAIFRYDGTEIASLPTTPVDAVGCAGIGGQTVGAILAFVQRPRQRIALPAGVGFTLAQHQWLLLNAHYINSTAEPLTIDFAVDFHAARKGSIRHHARSFQLGTLRIAVPPGANGDVSAEWTTPFPMNVVWLSTHSHKHTLSADVDLLRAGANAGQLLETTVYSEPTVQPFTTPLRLATGDGFEWTCRYHNDTSRLLTFGVTSNDEMCFAVGFFYPDDDAAALPHVPGCFGSGHGLVCPLN